jgi:TolB-like protein/cytochrome c-type biogenesis protein CcmH/NrfG
MEWKAPSNHSETVSGGRAGADPCDAEIRAQLERILASDEFNVPNRVRQFLSYIVEQTLTGRSDRIKAYSVAVEVFGRDENSDIHNDPVVRIEAGRLRRGLERYYLLAGKSDPVLIEVPKGSYVPHFRWRSSPSDLWDKVSAQPSAQTAPLQRGKWRARRPWLVAAALGLVACAVLTPLALQNLPSETSPVQSRDVPEGPSLVVRPFLNLSTDTDATLYAAGITEEVLVQLARFKELTVFGRETTQAVPSSASAPEIHFQLGSRYILEGSVRVAAGRVRVTSRVLFAETGAVLWSQSYDADLRVSDIVDVETDIASKVATAVAQPYGIIFGVQPKQKTGHPPDSLEAYQCALQFYQYRSILNGTEHASTRDCLEQTVKRYPNHATAWAMLSYLYLDEDRFNLNRRSGSPGPIERARDAAEHAVRLDGQNVRALQALMTVLFFNQEPREALRIGEQAYALNPNDTELLGELGSRVAQAGDWKRGSELLEQALARNPGNSSYYLGMLAQAAYMQHDNERAVALIRRADLKRFSIYHVVAAIIFASAGFEAEAAESRAQFLRMRPDFFDNFEAELAKRNFNARDRAILIEGARHAGFPVKLPTQGIGNSQVAN